MKEIELPDGSIAEFPDGMSDDSIKQVLRQKFPPTQQQTPQQQPESRGIGERVLRAAQNVPSRLGQQASDFGTGALTSFYGLGQGAANLAGGVSETLGLPGQENVSNNVNRINAYIQQRRQAIEAEKARRSNQGLFNVPETLGEIATQLPFGFAGKAGLLKEAGQSALQTAAFAPVETGGQDYVGEKAKQALTAAVATPVFRGLGALGGLGKGKELPLSPEQQIIKEAENRGVPIRTSDLMPPTTRAGRSAELSARLVPFVGTGGQVAKQQESRLSAVSDELVKYNPDLGQNPETLKLLSDEITSSVKGSIKKLREDKLSILNNALYNTGETVPLTKTNEKIDELINKWTPNAGAGSEEATKLVSQLTDLKNRFNSNTGTKFLENERELLSTQYADNPTVKSLANQIYGPLNEDMGSFIKGKNLADYSKWKFSNKKISSMIDENQYSALGKIIDKSEVTPEIVKTSIFSKKPSDLKRLNQNLSPDGRKKVQSVIIGDISDKISFTKPDGTKVFSPEKFISEIDRKKDQISVFFDPKDKASLEGLARVMNATRGAGQAALNPLTGMQLAGVTSLGVLGNLTGTAAGGASLATGIGLAGRAYESKPFRDLLLTLSKIKKNSSEERLLINKIISMQAGQLAAKENTKERN
jgi:hypothetical protein